MDRYFAVLTLDRLDEVKRRCGYAEAMERLDTLRRALEVHHRRADCPQTSRTAVEFLFQAGDIDAAEALLLDLTAALAGTAAGEEECPAGRILCAAVPVAGDLSDDLVAEAYAELARAGREKRTVSVARVQAIPDGADQIAEALRAALRRGELALAYQPKIHCRSCEVAGVEALLRWTHPSLGPMSPELFIPAAEKNGVIGPLTSWVVQRAMADQRRLRASGLDVPIHVNISAPLIGDANFVDEMLAGLRSGTATLGFEITETAMMADPEGTLANLHRLASAGIHLAIDDYGSGFSSLAYLQRLPIQELKIDKMFISRLAQGSRDPLLVRSTIDLAHALEMEVTAEGVETAAVFALLQVMRCDLVQGYFLSPALTPDELLDFVRRGAVTDLTRPASLRERLARRRSGGEPVQ